MRAYRDRGSGLVRWILARLVPEEWRESVAGDFEEERVRRQAAGRSAGFWWIGFAALCAGATLRWDRGQHGRSGEPVRGGRIGEGLAADLRQVARGLSLQRMFAVTATLALALGIGATTAVFTLTNALLLRPIPGIVEPSRLVTIHFGAGGGTGPVALVAVDTLAAGAPGLALLAATGSFAANVELGGTARRLDAEIVNDHYFSVLGNALALGRAFTADESRQPSAPPAAIVSFRIWREALGSAPGVLGAPLTINGDRWTIVGVAREGFLGPSRTMQTDLWVPVAQFARVMPTYRNALTSPGAKLFMTLFGRLAPGATANQVAAQLEVVRARLSATRPTDFQLRTWRFLVTAGITDRVWVQDTLSQSMFLLLGFVLLLLLLTCANVANLLLVRALGRRAEIATRVALGASRARIVRLLLLESFVLAAGGGTLALALSALVGRLFAGTVVLQGVPPIDAPQIDWRVFAFAVLVSGGVSVAAGLAPAWTGSREAVGRGMRDDTRTITPRRYLQQGLAILQVAVSLTLAVGACLLARSMVNRDGINPGFDTSRVLAFSVDPSLRRYDPDRLATFYRETLARVRAVPGVRGAGFTWLQPFSPNAGDQEVRADGQPEASKVSAEYNVISPGVFGALALPILEGRDFKDAELFSGSAPDGPAIISASLRQALFGGGSAVGRRLRLAYPEGATRIVAGVVADMRQRRVLEPPAHLLFDPMTAGFASWGSIVIGLAAPADAVVPIVRRTMAAFDPTLPIYHVTTLAEEIARQMAEDALIARLAITFAVLATLLAALGLYGVLSRVVAERRREFGIRLALGARSITVMGLIASEAGRVVGLGLLAGLAASAFLSRLIESWLFGVTPADPLSTAGAVTIVVFIAVAASQPALRRAAHLDPAVVLRDA